MAGFGTTSGPCCATFALQKHVKDHATGNEDVLQSIKQFFSVDNCLQRLPTAESDKRLLDKMQQCLASGGFKSRQWASSFSSVVSNLPSSARSESTELWLTEKSDNTQGPAHGLQWHCPSDWLGYKPKPPKSETPTMRYIYHQYYPLGIIIPYTTRANNIVHRL